MARPKTKKSDEVTLYIRVPATMYDRISRRAKEMRRSIAMQSCDFLERGMNQEQKEYEAAQAVSQ